MFLVSVFYDVMVMAVESQEAVKRLLQTVSTQNRSPTSYSDAAIIAEVAKFRAACDTPMYLYQSAPRTAIYDSKVSMIAQSSPNPECFNSQLIKLGEQLYCFGRVPGFTGREDIGFDASDFPGVADKAIACLKCFGAVLKQLSEIPRDHVQPNTEKIIRVWLVKGLWLALEHSSGEALWTSPESLQMSKDLIQTLLDLNQCSSLTDLLCKKPDNAGSDIRSYYVHTILAEICSQLTRANWKQKPSVSHVYAAVLASTVFPHLGERLDMVLPSALIIIDDHELSNKIQGVKCLKHIMSNVSHAELRRHGKAEVIYDSLQRYTHSHEECLLSELYPALRLVLQITEGSPNKVSKTREENKYDKILRRLLTDMELENRIVLRWVYIEHLPEFITDMGIVTVRHTQSLLRVLENYLDVYDGPKELARSHALKCVKVTLQQTWPRIPSHCQQIFKMLLKFVYDISTDSSLTPVKVKEDLVEQAAECLTLLGRISPVQVCELCTSVAELDLGEQSREVVRALQKQTLQ